MLSLADLKRRIDKGELSADAALAQSVSAIEAQEKAIGAFAFRADKLRAQQQGPLRGIAVGIKDIIDTADLPTEMGAAIYKGYRPRADAPIVMMLKQAGATIAGKTTTTAFAANDPTATVNPHNTGAYAGRLVVRFGRGRCGRYAAACRGHADRRLGDPAGLVLRRRRDQAVLPAAADGRRQSFSWSLEPSACSRPASRTWRSACPPSPTGRSCWCPRPSRRRSASSPRILPGRRTRRGTTRCASRLPPPRKRAHR